VAKRVLVVGDIVLDHYIYVTSSRRAAEADIPVWDHELIEYRLGGAANVANNLKSLGGQEIDVQLAGIAARTGHTNHDRNFIAAAGIGTMLVGGTETMYKHRYVDCNNKSRNIIFRADNFTRFDWKEVEEYERFFCGFVGEVGTDADVVVVSDYDKGTVTPKIMESVFKMMKGRAVIVDSKRSDLSIFEGAQVLKLNELEAGAQVGNPKYIPMERLAPYVVVTKGAAGAELRMYDPKLSRGRSYVVHTEQFGTETAEPVDVTGCGDTHTAALAFSLLENSDVRRAVRFANACATAAVRKFGTSAVYPRDVKGYDASDREEDA
jgi:rfaE bifunctional protein kinase chain/domain